MPDISKRHGLSAAVFICFTSGCANIDTAFDNDYLDYTTDKVEYIDIEPKLGAALPNEDRVRRSLYTSAGIGASLLTPDTDAAPNVEVDESVVAGGQVTLGLDLNKHLSLEMHSADLGSAGLSPVGRVNYHLNGASALYYAGKNRHNRGRRGLSAFGRLGAGSMENTPVGPVNFTREEEIRPLYGAGLEYNMRSGLGLRAEVISFDTDAQYAQLGLMYRLGQRLRDDIEVVEIVDPPIAPVVLPDPVPAATPPAPVAPAEPVIAAASMPKDTDRDGVLDRRDECPATVRGSTVDRQGCAIFSGTIEGINFQTASAELTDASVDILDDISRTLRDYPRTHLTIKAHTDNQGDANKNQQLSERRARTVVDFLARRGFPYNRMTAKAYGERSPMHSNETADGRARNRRVELFASTPR